MIRKSYFLESPIFLQSQFFYRKKYNIYEGIVADRVEEVGAENSLEEILSLKVSYSFIHSFVLFIL